MLSCAFDLHVWRLPFTVLTGCLQIEKATHSNDGLYTLAVRNEFGSVNKSVEAQFHKGMYPNNLLYICTYLWYLQKASVIVLGSRDSAIILRVHYI